MLRSKPKPELIVHRDGRVELRGALYSRMRSTLCDLAGSKCEIALCGGKYTGIASGHAHHQNGRGGGRRDDRIWLPATEEEVTLINRALGDYPPNLCKGRLFLCGDLFSLNGDRWMKRNLYWACPSCHGNKHVPDKVVPAKPKYSEEEFRQLMGIN